MRDAFDFFGNLHFIPSIDEDLPYNEQLVIILKKLLVRQERLDEYDIFRQNILGWKNFCVDGNPVNFDLKYLNHFPSVLVDEAINFLRLDSILDDEIKELIIHAVRVQEISSDDKKKISFECAECPEEVRYARNCRGEGAKNFRINIGQEVYSRCPMTFLMDDPSIFHCITLIDWSDNSGIPIEGINLGDCPLKAYNFRQILLQERSKIHKEVEAMKPKAKPATTGAGASRNIPRRPR